MIKVMGGNDSKVGKLIMASLMIDDDGAQGREDYVREEWCCGKIS